MTELSTGELADAMVLTFRDFEERCKRVGAHEALKALANMVSEECDKRVRLKALERASGMTGDVGSES